MTRRFGEKLYQLRISHHMTLQTLADQLGYKAHGYISELETGKKVPTLTLVLKVARLFDLTTDELLKDEFDLALETGVDKPIMDIPLAERNPTPIEVERLRLILSTFQDGTGQLAQSEGRTLPGWRDFERAVALTFGGSAQESKAIFDILISDLDVGIRYGISCKMRGTLNELRRTGRATIELSNSAGKFWKALNVLNLGQESYKQHPQLVGKALIELVKSWHRPLSESQENPIDLSRSRYLLLSWNKAGEYQLHLFSLELPLVDIAWSFPEDGARLIGADNRGRVYEWYGESGGQLKYYPLAEHALWASDPFKLEPLPISDSPYTLLAKVTAYFPERWHAATP